MSEPVNTIPFELALHIALCWRQGKMIGGDEDAVREALLRKIEEQAEELDACYMNMAEE